jgi:hypothetical protein
MYSFPGGSFSVPRLKLALLLPVVQVGITAILTQWADRVSWILLGSSRAPGPLVHLHLFVIELRVIWRGINAPAFPLGQLAWVLPTYRILGFGVDDLFYLVGVLILWHLVGRKLDRRRTGIAGAESRTATTRILFTLFMMALGLYLFILSLVSFHEEFSFARGYYIRFYGLAVCSLFLLWSLILITSSGLKLRHNISSERVGTDAEG